MKTIIFDIDGTLLNISYRVSKALQKDGSIDYPTFHQEELLNTDIVIQDTLDIFNLYKDKGYYMVLMTGRDGNTRDITEKMLSDFNIDYDMLFMREENDYLKDSPKKDSELKRGWYNLLTKAPIQGELLEIKGVFEDRESVVDMWREEGLTCYQPDYGKF